MQVKTTWLAAAFVLAAATSGYGQAIISSTDGFNTIYLGINSEGHLNLAPGNVVAQMKNQLSPAFEDIPRLGDDRSWFELLVKFRQPDHQVGNDVEGDMVRRQRPVETGRLRAEIDGQSPIAQGFAPWTEPEQLVYTEICKYE